MRPLFPQHQTSNGSRAQCTSAARPGSRSRSSDLANEPTHGELPACVLSQSVDGFLQGDCGVVALSVVPV